MTIVVILNIVFAAFVVISIVGLLAGGILSDRTANAGLERRRIARARARRTSPARRGFGAALDAS